MPRLTRIRLVSVGHAGARFDDLLLDLRERSGGPTDSTLWLRNGGGKTSLLSLFFSLLRPNKREFLGLKVTGKTEGRPNELKDFILPDDRSVVVSEWALDGGAALFADEQPQRYLTGVFCERRAGTDEEIQRLFFAGYVSKHDPALQIDGLPLHTSPEQRARRTLSSFRQEWLALRERNPSLQVACTDNLGEWAQILDGVGIDSELFAYQLRMNRRESGADELFRFSDHERFIDFLLEVAHTSDLGDRLRQNLGTLRQQMLERKDRLLPEQELIAGLLERHAPLIEITKERQHLSEAAGREWAKLAALRSYVTQRLDALDEEKTAKHAEQEKSRLRSVDCGQSAVLARSRAAGLRRQVAKARLQRAEEDAKRIDRRREDALRQRDIWEAAGPLRRALDAEQRITENRRLLLERQHEHAPLRESTEQAAAELAAALIREARNLQADARRQGTYAEAEEQLARSAAKDVATASAAQAQCTKDIQRFELALCEIEKRRTQLLEKGALREGESTGEAIGRLEASLRTAEQDCEAQQASADDHRRMAEGLTQELPLLERSQANADAAAQALERELKEEAQTERSICASPLLARLFDIESKEVRLERLLEPAMSRLPAEIERIDQQKMRLRSEQAADERACFALEQTGLLPPRPEVEAVIERLPRAWSGWQYLAENKATNHQRRECVLAAPHLADGIVVRDEDFADAIERLAREPARFSVPVAVGRAGSLLESKVGQWQVFGPHSDAYFDRSAARTEMQSRQERLQKIGGELANLEALRAEAEQLRHQLVDYHRRWPPGWRLEKDATFQKARLDAHTLRSQSEQTVARANEHRRLEVAARVAEKAANRAARELTSVLDLVQAFYRDHESLAETHRQAMHEAEKARHTYQEQLERASQEESAHAEQAQQANRQAQTRSLAAQRLDDECGRIAYLTAEVNDDESQRARPLESLRARYSGLRDQYEQRVGQDGLQKLIENDVEQARTARQELDRKLDAPRRNRDGARSALLVEEIEQALRSLTDPTQLETQQQEASEAYTSAHGAKARQDQLVQYARETLKKSEEHAATLGVGEEEPILEDIEATEAAALQAELAAERLANEQVEHSRAASEAGQEAEHLRRQHDGLRKDAERARSLGDSYDDVLTSTAPSMLSAGSAAEPSNDAEVEHHINAIENRLVELRRQLGQLSQRLQDAARKVRGFAQDRRFESLNSPVARQFAEAPDAQLESRAVLHREELITRIRALQSEIAKLEKHREFLIDVTLEAAREGLNLLSAAATSSRIPEHVPGLGGVNFLTIRDSVPQSPADRRARIGQFVDKILSEQELPTGLGLVQQAVRELAKPIRARVLNPDPDLDRRSVEIPELARFSGGERLTCAVLLYCTLAQLRAKTRGVSRLPSSVLFLDNPIGASSRVRFLDIQRDVAQAMRIQLVYTTGVNDLDALATLPNVIRLRNERIDRSRGHRHVESTPTNERRIASTRILLRPIEPSPQDKAP